MQMATRRVPRAGLCWPRRIPRFKSATRVHSADIRTTLVAVSFSRNATDGQPMPNSALTVRTHGSELAYVRAIRADPLEVASCQTPGSGRSAMLRSTSKPWRMRQRCRTSWSPSRRTADGRRRRRPRLPVGFSRRAGHASPDWEQMRWCAKWP